MWIVEHSYFGTPIWAHTYTHLNTNGYPTTLYTHTCTRTYTRTLSRTHAYIEVSLFIVSHNQWFFFQNSTTSWRLFWLFPWYGGKIQLLFLMHFMSSNLNSLRWLFNSGNKKNQRWLCCVASAFFHCFQSLSIVDHKFSTLIQRYFTTFFLAQFL